MTLRFTWNENKAAVNKCKHHVSFDMAARIFSDPFALSEQDRIEDGEYRWRRSDRSMGSSCWWSPMQRMTGRAGQRSSASFRLAAPSDMKGDAMSKKDIVRYEVDPVRPSPLTAAQKAELGTLAALPDDRVDTSEIPPLSEDFWKNAVRNPFYRPVKKQLTVRVDADVLAWLRLAGKGYQTKLNAILRRAMLRDVTKS
jgi:uncharacterized protein (DUF4415 family)